ncbi:MAG TPA: alkaline phosphatase family protein [Blastocatellia bacterium]|nr:alkaline phosphatase family protein [Blastocatellia bacterium]
MITRWRIALSILLCVAAAFIGLPAAASDDDDHDEDEGSVARVLLISIDGMHAVDLARYVAGNPTSTLAQLSRKGRTYTNAIGAKPSDSFPGLLAMITGGTPRSTGVYYDDTYDRSLAAASGPCVAGARVQWKQNLDVTPLTYTTVLDQTKLPRNPADGCTTRVFPHQYPRVNNVFELVKGAGGRTAWSDKHPAYEWVNGPSGTGVDDLYTPEIQTAVGGVVTTNSFSLTMAYDDMKVAAIVNEINGLDHTGSTTVGTPTLFGMNFQAVSVGQKLAENGVTFGGYVDAAATPTAPLKSAIDHTDQSIGSMVNALRARGLLESTLIIISAKHGNSPIDPATLVKVDPNVIVNIVNSVPPGLALLSADTGPLIWLKDQTTTAAVVAALNTPANRAAARINTILSGPDLAALYPDPLTDTRTPDIILLPIPGTVYTTSATKIADHGSFGEDDVHVALLVSNPRIPRKVINQPVETRQIACTILKSLGLSCRGLASERIEPSRALPNSNHGGDHGDDHDGDRDH